MPSTTMMLPVYKTKEAMKKPERTTVTRYSHDIVMAETASAKSPVVELNM